MVMFVRKTAGGEVEDAESAAERREEEVDGWWWWSMVRLYRGGGRCRFKWFHSFHPRAVAIISIDVVQVEVLPMGIELGRKIANTRDVT